MVKAKMHFAQIHNFFALSTKTHTAVAHLEIHALLYPTYRACTVHCSSGRPTSLLCTNQICGPETFTQDASRSQHEIASHSFR